jgi:hypothetical protein
LKKRRNTEDIEKKLKRRRRGKRPTELSSGAKAQSMLRLNVGAEAPTS